MHVYFNLIIFKIQIIRWIQNGKSSATGYQPPFKIPSNTPFSYQPTPHLNKLLTSISTRLSIISRKWLKSIILTISSPILSLAKFIPKLNKPQTQSAAMKEL